MIDIIFHDETGIAPCLPGQMGGFENTDGEMPKGKQKSIGDKTMIEKLKKAIRYYQYRKASRAKARQMVKLLRLSGAIRKLK